MRFPRIPARPVGAPIARRLTHPRAPRRSRLDRTRRHGPRGGEEGCVPAPVPEAQLLAPRRGTLGRGRGGRPRDARGTRGGGRGTRRRRAVARGGARFRAHHQGRRRCHRALPIAQVRRGTHRPAARRDRAIARACLAAPRDRLSIAAQHSGSAPDARRERSPLPTPPRRAAHPPDAPIGSARPTRPTLRSRRVLTRRDPPRPPPPPSGTTCFRCGSATARRS